MGMHGFRKPLELIEHADAERRERDRFFAGHHDREAWAAER